MWWQVVSGGGGCRGIYGDDAVIPSWSEVSAQNEYFRRFIEFNNTDHISTSD